jgi:hypothetical protein
MGRYDYDVKFSDLEGKKVVKVEGLERGSEKVTFICDDGEKFSMEYFRDCCASCSVEDVCGDPADLIGTIVRAEDPSSLDEFNEEKEAKLQTGGDYMPESYTWTFFIVGTTKGTLTIRWYGSSNGYYSESPSFYRDDEET